jgi:hypothetical protein
LSQGQSSDGVYSATAYATDWKVLASSDRAWQELKVEYAVE